MVSASKQIGSAVLLNVFGVGSSSVVTDAFVASPSASAQGPTTSLRASGSAAPAFESVGGTSSSGSSASASPLVLPIVGACAAVAAFTATTRPSAQRRNARVARRADGVTTAVKERQEEEVKSSMKKEAGAPETARTEPEEVKPPPPQADLQNAIPFLGAPAYRTFVSNVPGDSGFDPLGICSDEETFIKMRDAEIKHCRLAMLAAVGWPTAEFFQPKLASVLGMKNDLAAGGLAPSVLNGGLLTQLPVTTFLLVFLLAAGYIDGQKPMPWVEPRIGKPGDYGFDPLGLKDWTPPGLPLFGSLPKNRNWMAEAEMKNGRLAMIAITYFVFDEFITKVPVVRG